MEDSEVGSHTSQHTPATPSIQGVAHTGDSSQHSTPNNKPHPTNTHPHAPSVPHHPPQNSQHTPPNPPQNYNHPQYYINQEIPYAYQQPCYSKVDLGRALQELISKGRAKKRKRARSPNRDESDSQDSSYGYDSDSGSESYDSESTQDSHNPRQAFPYNGDMYLYWDRNEHHYIDPTKIRWGGQVFTVKWHPEVRAFCLVKETPSESTFIAPQLGHQYIMDCLKLENKSDATPGPHRKYFDTTFGTDLGVFKLLTLIKDKEVEINHLLVADEVNGVTTAMDKIPNDIFKTISIANFSEGWTLSSNSFLDWAKDELLSPEDAAIAMGLDYTPRVSSSILKDELNARNELVHFLSGLRLLELFSSKLEDSSMSTTLQTISQYFLPTLKKLVITWMASKILVRRKFLNNKKSPGGSQLLKGSLWCSKIFPEDIINSLKSKGAQRPIAPMIFGPSTSYSSSDFYSRKRRRREDKNKFNKRRRNQYRSEYTDARHSSPPYSQGTSKYRKERSTKKVRRSAPKPKKEEGPTESKSFKKGNKSSKSSAGRYKKK